MPFQEGFIRLVKMSLADNFTRNAYPPDCGDCPIRKQAICAQCQPDELAALNAMKSYRTYKKDEMIAYADAEMRYVSTLVTGLASISQGLEDGRRQIMGILMPSDFVGRPGRKRSKYDI